MPEEQTTEEVVELPEGKPATTSEAKRLPSGVRKDPEIESILSDRDALDRMDRHLPAARP